MHSATGAMRHLGRAGGRIATLIVLACITAEHAAAQDILLTGGSMEWDVADAIVHLSGDHDFAASGLTDSSTPLNGSCHHEGDMVSVASGAIFGDWKLNVAVTLDGAVQTFSENDSILRANFAGSVIMPRVIQSTARKVPVVFGGGFQSRFPARPLGLTLLGTGLATVTFVPLTPLDSCMRSVRYDLGAPLPAPWRSADVGSLVRSAGASYVDDQFVLVGGGADIWGTADAFRFAFVPLGDSGSVTAHVAGANSVAPLDWLQPRQQPSEFAKAGVMVRASPDPASASVILDVKSDGSLEFMVRYASGEPTHFIAGAPAAPQDVWLRLSRETENQIAATYSPDGVNWSSLGTVSVLFDSDEILAGLAVASHQTDALYAALFDHVSISGTTGRNLLVNGDFEADEPPALGPPGWISDQAIRQSPAKSETHQPRSGAQNGACWTPEFLDCGIYQDVVAPATGTYTYIVYAGSDRAGGLVGANVNSVVAASSDVTAASFGDYSRHTLKFAASAGDVIRVWMYSPASPGYVVIDDASLMLASE